MNNIKYLVIILSILSISSFVSCTNGFLAEDDNGDLQWESTEDCYVPFEFEGTDNCELIFTGSYVDTETGILETISFNANGNGPVLSPNTCYTFRIDIDQTTCVEFGDINFYTVTANQSTGEFERTYYYTITEDDIYWQVSPQGIVEIIGSSEWVFCLGDDCSVVPNIIET